MRKFDLLEKKQKNYKSTCNHFYCSDLSGYCSYRLVYRKNRLTYSFSLRI
jgi:hypothetical protein